MEERRVDGAMESPLESEEGGKEPAKVRVIPYPVGFKSQFVKGLTFLYNGEIFEVYQEKGRKAGGPRFLIRGIGIVAVVEDSKPAVTFEDAVEAAEDGVTDYMRGESQE